MSLDNSVITKDAAGFLVSDLPASKNGTTLNWNAVPRGGAARLAHGDLVGAGRSLLLFRDD